MIKKDGNNIEMYLCSYIFKKERISLIWISDNGNDRFKLNEEKTILFSKSEEKLKEMLGEESEKVNWIEDSVINFDKFWTALRNLRINRASSINTCNLLLDGWNFIEDLLRTFGLDNEMKSLRTPLLNKAYEKLFCGCNLPSVTPEGKSYSPLWTYEEILVLRKEFRVIWKILRKNGYIVP